MGRRLALESEITQVDDLVTELREAQFAVLRGDVHRAVAWAETHGLVSGDPPVLNPSLEEPQEFVRRRLRKYEYLVIARLFLLQERGSPALQLLESLLTRARALGRTDLTIEIDILRALAWQVEQEEERASGALVEALRLAEPGGYIRIFVDEGEPMARLLRRAASKGSMTGYANILLASYGETGTEEAKGGLQIPAGARLIDPLTDRELEVLALLAAGLSNPDIAAELYVAVSTVRSHCKSIYQKLDVHSRWDAAVRGRELGLL
jgi:LuxR family maltose regulon positive regulatory protein